jgi:hypothetical protein
MQNTKLFMAATAAALLAILAGLGYQRIYSQTQANPSPTGQSVQTDLAQPVAEYLELLPESGPPNINPTAVEQMVGLLTANAQSQLLEPHSRGLAMFAGIQDLPDQGTSIAEIIGVSQTQAEVKTIWNYSGAQSLKTFIMVNENGSWKIDQIR